MKKWIVFHGGGVWFRIAGRWRGLFLSAPFIRVPLIAGGSDGMPAQGSYLLLEMAGSPGSPTTMSEIAEVTNIAGGGGTTEQIDFTHLRSPGRRREFKPSFIDSGTLSFTVQYIPTDATHIQLLALQDSGEEVALREVFPDATGWDYQGFVQSITKSGQTVGGKILLDVVFKITGTIDFSGTGSPA